MSAAATFAAADMLNASSAGGGGWTRAPAAYEHNVTESSAHSAAVATAAELPFDGAVVAVAVVSGACALAGSALNLLLGAAVLLAARRRRGSSSGYRRRGCGCCCCWSDGLGPADVYVASIAGADLLLSCVYLPCVAVGNAYRADLFGSGGCFLLTWLQTTCVGVIWANHCAMALHWAALTFAADARMLRWRGRVASAAAVAASWAAMGALSAVSSSRDSRFAGSPNYHCSAEYRAPYQLTLMAARLALPVLLAPVAYVVAFARIVRFEAVVRGECRAASGRGGAAAEGGRGAAESGRTGGGDRDSGRGVGALSITERDCCSASDSGGGGVVAGSSAESGVGSEVIGDGVAAGDGRRPSSGARELRMLRSTIVMFVVFSVLYTLSTVARLGSSNVFAVTAGHCALYVTSVANASLLLSINRNYGRALGRMLCGKGTEMR